MECNLDGGLWPFFWCVLVICITYYNLNADKKDDKDPK